MTVASAPSVVSASAWRRIQTSLTAVLLALGTMGGIAVAATAPAVSPVAPAAAMAPAAPRQAAAPTAPTGGQDGMHGEPAVHGDRADHLDRGHRA